MKKFFALTLVCILLLCAVSCGSSDPVETTDSPETTSGDVGGTDVGDETTYKPYNPLEDGMLLGGTDGVYWRLKDGILSVFGEGDAALPASGTYPWASYADRVKEITIGTGVTSVSENAFAGFASVTRVWIEDASVSSIGAGAFSGCTALTYVKLGDALGEIPADCFKGCSALESISVPSATSAVGADAFSGCSAFRSVSFEGSEAEWNAITVGSGNDALLSAEVFALGG